MRNHRCCGKAMSIIYCECVYILALLVQHALRMRHIVIRGRLDRTIFFHIIL
jgi:hypothetical protein